MSNRSYLVASNMESLYPSFADKRFDASKHLVANDVECLPLLWLALFREGDLQQKVFNVEGDDVPAYAPLCSVAKAVRQLNESVPYLQKILPWLGPLKGYAAMLQQAIEEAGYAFLTIELEEIASMYPDEHRFEELLTLSLRGFDPPHDVRFECEDVSFDLADAEISFETLDGEEIEAGPLQDDEDDEDDGDIESEIVTIEGFTANSHAEILERIASLRHSERLPSVRMYLDDLDYTEDEQWNFTRVLGAGLHGSMGYGREVPWEKEDANFGTEFFPADDDEDDDEEDE